MHKMLKKLFPFWLQQKVEEEEEQVPVGARVVAGQSVYQHEPPPAEEQNHGGRALELDGEEKEDLPEQPPPPQAKPKESKSSWELATSWLIVDVLRECPLVTELCMILAV